jgi:hypothetical protein
MTKIVAACIAVSLYASAQTEVDLRTQSKSSDLSAGPTKTLQIGTTPPANCSVGQVFFSTSAVAGGNIYGCTATNVWSQMDNIPVGITAPSSCIPGQVFFNTSAPAGSNFYGCTATNTFTPLTGNAFAVKTDGTLAGTESTLNLVSSPALTYTVVDDGTNLNITPLVQSSYFASRPEAQNGVLHACAPISGNASAYTCTLPYTLPAYSDGMLLVWKPDVSCLGAAAITLNVDSNGAVQLYQSDGASFLTSAQCTAGSQNLLVFGAALNGNLGGWRLLSSTSVLPPVAHALGVNFDGGGSALTSGRISYLADVPFTCTISGWSLAVDQGTASVDVWMTTDGLSVPTSSQSITGSAPPSIVTGTRLRSGILTGWTTLVAQHNVLAVKLTAVSGAPTTANFALECDK